MPTVRERQRSVTQARILEAAVQLFSRQGFHGTGTREIAKLAGINEATIFRYFPGKKQLFWAALEIRLSRVKMSRELLNGLSQGDSAETVLPMVFRFIVDTMSDQPELIRLLHVSALELQGGEDVYRRHLGQIFDLITAYVNEVQSSPSKGKLDSQVVTAGLIGMVVAHRSLNQLFLGRELPFASSEDATLAYSSVWLRLLKSQ